MRTDAYPIPNSLHFIQVANSPEHCPVFPGDTRITVIHVPKPKVDIPREVLMARLLRRGPRIHAHAVGYAHPGSRQPLSDSRIETQNKMALQDLNRGYWSSSSRKTAFRLSGSGFVFPSFGRSSRHGCRPRRSEWSRKRVTLALRG